jgi:hypothetical protein
MAARQPRMIMIDEGAEGSGKTDFALRNTPRPCMYLDFDFGCEGVGGVDNEKLLEGVTLKQYDPFGPMTYNRDEEMDQKRARGEMDRFLADFRAAIKDRVPLLVVDTFTAAWAAQRVARKDDRYLDLEAEFHGLIRSAYMSSHTNLILIHHLKKDWARSGDKAYPTGTYSRDGLDSVGTMVQLGIRHTYTPPKIAGGNLLEQPRFDLTIWKARDNIAMVGQKHTIREGEENYIDWPTLCTMVCPGVDWFAQVAR